MSATKTKTSQKAAIKAEPAPAPKAETDAKKTSDTESKDANSNPQGNGTATQQQQQQKTNNKRAIDAGLLSINDSKVWRRSLTNEAIQAITVSCEQPKTPNDKVDGFFNSKNTDGRTPEVITVPLYLADAMLYGGGSIPKVTEDPTPLSAQFYGLATSELPEDFVKTNPQLKEDLKDFMEVKMVNWVKHYLAQMYDSKIVQPAYRLECQKNGVQEYKTQCELKKVPYNLKGVDADTHEEIRPLILKHWYKKAKVFFNKRISKEEGQENKSAAELLEEETFIPKGFFFTMPVWVLRKGQKKKAIIEKYKEEAAKLKEVTIHDEIRIMKELGVGYNRIEYYRHKRTQSIRDEKMDALRQRLTEYRHMQRQAGKIVDEDAFKEMADREYAAINSIFNNECPRGSIVILQIYLEPYSQTGGHWGVRIKAVPKITLLKKGVESINTPMITSEEYGGCDDEDYYQAEHDDMLIEITKQEVKQQEQHDKDSVNNVLNNAQSNVKSEVNQKEEREHDQQKKEENPKDPTSIFDEDIPTNLPPPLMDPNGHDDDDDDEKHQPPKKTKTSGANKPIKKEEEPVKKTVSSRKTRTIED